MDERARVIGALVIDLPDRDVEILARGHVRMSGADSGTDGMRRYHAEIGDALLAHLAERKRDPLWSLRPCYVTAPLPDVGDVS
ncbi:MAG: hypothetical protein QOF00_5974 [Pseudonocardiales bacterium]|jgi:hypothetical protein|nr:hypothetical protein [Pseudonocardiales bacterium]